MDRPLKTFLYFTGWIGAWIIFSSIINAGFIAVTLYPQEGKGKLITFFISGIISLAGATSLYREVFSSDQ